MDGLLGYHTYKNLSFPSSRTWELLHFLSLSLSAFLVT